MRAGRVSGTVEHCTETQTDGRFFVVIKVRNQKISGYSDRRVEPGSSAAIEEGRVV